MIDFGKGPTLEEANPWLRDKTELVDRILDVVECNCVIEGLPPFLEETRCQLRDELMDDSEPEQLSG